MPANWHDPRDHRVMRWSGMVIKKFKHEEIQVLPIRREYVDAPRAIDGLVGLLCNDDLAMAMWEAL